MHKTQHNDALDMSDPICFVIMPFTDPPGYDEGHFKRIYNHIFQPAIIEAGYQPLRCDEINNGKPIHSNMFKQLEFADMVLCDLSSSNPNVLYELGRRDAHGKPFVLVQEEGHDQLFNIREYPVIPYRKTLRCDEVPEDLARVANAIKQTGQESSSDSSVSVKEWVPELQLRTNHYKTWDTAKQRADFPSLQIEPASTAFLSNSSRDLLLHLVLKKVKIRTRLFQNYDSDTRKFAQETIVELTTLMHNFKAHNIRDELYYDLYSEATDLLVTLSSYIGDQLINFLRSSNAISALIIRDNHDPLTKAFAQAKLDELNELISSYKLYCHLHDPNFKETYRDAENFRSVLVHYLE